MSNVVASVILNID